jgi:SAM-dependent methyltransferase
MNVRADLAVNSVNEHYDTLLADHYTWMAGGHAEMVAGQRRILTELGLLATGSDRALDLGCGSGFQSVALAQLGFQVTALDFSRKLLGELVSRQGQLSVTALEGDIRDVASLVAPGFAVAVCMGDTLTHLPSRESMIQMLANVSHLLDKGGALVLSFRDLTVELTGTERFIPVRSDFNRIMTCFLEYEPDAVLVHDLVHVRDGKNWTLHKSSYRKLRVSLAWVVERLKDHGFIVYRAEIIDGMSVVAAVLL